MNLLLILLLSAYLALVLILWNGWKKIGGLNGDTYKDKEEDLPKVSIIIPVRNEANNVGNLLKDLEIQDYPGNKYEVLIIDDASEDNTVEIINGLNSPLEIKLYPLIPTSFKSKKKAAITQGVNIATGDLILCTDGDTRVGPKWVKSMVSHFDVNKHKFISGPVNLQPANSLITKMQQIEFLSLIGTGAASIYYNLPTMCNGANMAFLKSAFEKVGGYSGKEDLPSGDDEFLMHKINKAFPRSIKFLKDDQAIVKTSPATSIRSFYSQRKRWAGKWKYYDMWQPKILAGFIFTVQLSLLLSLFAVIIGLISIQIFISIIALKYLLDYFYLNSINRFFKNKINLLAFTALQIIYPLYVIIIGLTSMFGPYSWKGRRYDK